MRTARTAPPLVVLGVSLLFAVLLGLLFMLQAVLSAAVIGAPARGWVDTFLIQSPPWLLWGLFAPAVFIALDRIGMARIRPLPALAVHALLALLVAALHSFVMTWVEWLFLPTIQAPSPWAILRYLLAVRTPSNVIVYALVSVVYHVVAYLGALHRSREEVRRLMGRRFEAVRQLAGGLAHQLNNQLVAVKAGAELALEILPPGHQAREEIEGIRRSARSIEGVGAELRALGGGLALQMVEVPVDEALEALAESLEGWVEAVQREPMSGEPASELPRLRVDLDHLREVVPALATEIPESARGAGPATVRDAGTVAVPRQLAGVLAPAARRRLEVEMPAGASLPLDPEALFEPRFKMEGTGVGPRLRAASARALLIQMGGWLDVRRDGEIVVFELWLQEA